MLILGISTIFLTVVPFQTHATMYRCYDRSGTMVLTDSPAQLEDCTVLDPKKPTIHISPATKHKSKRLSRVRQTENRFPPPKQEPREEFSPQDEGEPEASQDKPSDTPVDPITVPVTKIGGSIVVQVLLNNSVDAHLIVDTGATMTVLSYDLGIELGLLSGSDVSLNTVNTAGGSVQVSMTKVGILQVGSAKASNVAVAIHDLPDAISGISGLLGMSFLKHFEVTLDADRGFLRLLPKANK